MEMDFNYLDDIDIDKEGITKKKFNKYIVIVPTVSIIITTIIIIISFYLLIKGDYKKEEKDEKDKEIIIKCVEGDDDYCKKCKNDECIKCNYRYNLINGSCIPTFSFKVIYETTEDRQNLQLINNEHQSRIFGLELDEEVFDINDAASRNYEFEFEISGNHTAYFSFNLSNLNGMLSDLFSSKENIIYIHFTKEFNTENITQIKLFSGFEKVRYIDISNFNIEKLIKMENLFYNCTSLSKVKLPNTISPNLIITEKLNNFESMFEGCKSLKSVDFSNFKGKNINNTKNMFNNCISLTSLNLSNFKTNNLNMDYMFNNCTSLSYLDISNFNDLKSFENCITNFPSKGTIKMNKNISENIDKFLPEGWIKL